MVRSGSSVASPNRWFRSGDNSAKLVDFDWSSCSHIVSFRALIAAQAHAAHAVQRHGGAGGKARRRPYVAETFKVAVEDDYAVVEA